jgi:hypothetical protein
MTDVVVTLDRFDLKTCRVGLLWIQRHRELHRQPANPAIDRAIEHLEVTLSMSASGPEVKAAEDNWITTRQYAERWGCSTRHARRIAPLIGGRKDGRDWLIPETAEGVT